MAIFLFFLPLIIGLGFGALRALVAGPKPIFGSQLKNKTVSTSSYGNPWPRCRGKVRLNGNMIWSTSIRESNHKTTSGGIFGIGQQSVYTYTYSVSCAIGFGYKLGGGAAGAFLKIYADGKNLYTAKISDASLGGTIQLSADGQLGDQNIQIASGNGSTLHLSIGDQILITYATTDADTTQDMMQQLYEIQTAVTLKANQSQSVGIFPPLIALYPAGGTITIPGLTTPLLDQTSFDPDPHDGSHPASGGYYPKKGFINSYYGSDTQNPDPIMVKNLGSGNCPAYRGLIYVVISDLELANYGNRIPNFSAEIDFESTAGPLGGTAGEIIGVQMTNYGSGYQTPPLVLFSGDGSGAEGSAILAGQTHISTALTGQILTVEMTSNGSRYTNATVAFTPTDGGSGAAGVAIVDSGSPQQPTTDISVTLSDVVAGILTEAGYSEEQYDVSALTLTLMEGIELDQESYQDSLKRLMGIYLFDSAEVDAQIIFNFRDGLPVIEIPEDDLGALADSTSNEPRIVESLQDEQTVPYFVYIRYYDPLRQYQQCTQYAKRISQNFASDALDALPVTNSRNSLTLDVPITELATTMHQQAEKILYDLWNSRLTAKFKLPYKYMRLDPTDIIEIPYKGDFLVVRLTTVNIGASLALECEGVAHDYHHSIALSDSGPGSGGTPKLPAGTTTPTTLILLDIPFIDDADTQAVENTGLYFAGATVLNSDSSIDRLTVDWHGCKVYRSVDQAPADFVSVGTTSVAAFVGTAINALADPDQNSIWDFDDGATLAVSWTGYDSTLQSGPSLPLSSSSDGGVTDNHENVAALIHTNGDIELLQFVNAEDNGDGTFTLSRLVRGVRGTETMAVGHEAGELFVLLRGTNQIQAAGHFAVDLGDRQHTRYYAAITDGSKNDFSHPIQETTTCRDLKPYAPYQITIKRDPLDNLIISWTRRSRFGGNWVDGTGGPLSEEFEAYEIEILSPSKTVLRTIKAPAPTIIYTPPQQIQDFGHTVGTVDLNVYQMSSVVGRGYPGNNFKGPVGPTFGTDPYVISFDIGPGQGIKTGVVEGDNIIHEHIIAGSVIGVLFPEGLPDSVAACRVAATHAYAITVNWIPVPDATPQQVATLLYSPGNKIGLFTMASLLEGHDFPVAAGQIIQFVAPPSDDATLSGIYFTVSGKRFTSMPGAVGT